MTRAKQKQRVLEFVARGEKIEKKEYNTSGLIPTISGPLFEEWMNEIKIFNDRYLKEHPLHVAINSTVSHHKGQLSSHKTMMGHLRALVGDSEYWQDTRPAETRLLFGIQQKTEEGTIHPWRYTEDNTFRQTAMQNPAPYPLYFCG